MHLQPHFTERIVHLPDSYQPNDTAPASAGGAVARRMRPAGDGFVFCSFNSDYKITEDAVRALDAPARCGAGKRALAAGADTLAKANLRREAATRGVDPGRLVFAPKLRMQEHLARQRLADLFLDTVPVNAHTTASDALWAGLPVLTCAGNASSAGWRAACCRRWACPN